MLSFLQAWKNNIIPLNCDNKKLKYLNKPALFSSLFVNRINKELRIPILSLTIVIESITINITNSMRMTFYPSRKCCFLQIQMQRNKEVSCLLNYYTCAGTIILPACIMLLLSLNNYDSNMCYVPFILTHYAAE